jgi:dienelactone hydrolase
VGALLIDTFAGRGLSKKDKYIKRLMRVNFPDQLSDAFAALVSLQTHPLVDGSRIGVMGYSMGGASAILAAYEHIASACTQSNQRFALHVGFYAPCIIRPEVTKTTGYPIIGLWGESDEATPKPRCDRIFNELKAGTGIVKSRWYPNAPHGWNGKSPAKFYRGVPNFAPCDWLLHPNGTITETTTGLTSDTDKQLLVNSKHCVEFGYTIGRHERTRKSANQTLLMAHPCLLCAEDKSLYVCRLRS